MSLNSIIKIVLLFTGMLVYNGCGTGERTNATKPVLVKDSTPALIKEDQHLNDSLQVTKQTKLYGKAIAAYIKAVYKKDKSSYDTLFFGKHTDFPDITLPNNVSGTHIVLLTSEAADVRRKHNPDLVYINMFGEITATNAHFFFVTFFPGYQHQYDYFFDFEKDEKSNEFVLDKIQFEDYAGRKKDNPERVVLFDKGKDVE